MNALRTQLLGAIAAGLALGCKSEAKPVAHPVPVEEQADAVATAPTPSPAPAPSSAGCAPDTTKEMYCLPVGGKPPKQMVDAPIEFDHNKCAVAHEVQDSCNGVHAVLSGPTLQGKQCCYEICKGMVAPCGRLLLDDLDRVVLGAVNVSSRHDPSTDVLPAAAREAWLADARLEHASVAAFARFSLELMTLGAPATLIEEAHRAALDELEHSRLCFELASSDEVRVTPGELPLDGVSIRTRMADIVRATADECCCGETFAAAVAKEALSLCVQPAARAALERIAADEARHAELGFRFVAWAVARFGAPAQRALDEGINRGRARLRTMHSTTSGLEAFGRLSTDAVARIARDVGEELLPPLAAALSSNAA